MSDTTDVFLLASRYAYRFPSERGPLTDEQLWDLPLTARNGFSLNQVAITINTELKGLQEESFVSVSPNPRRDELINMLELVKQIIAIKQAEAKAQADRVAKAALREQLREAIAAKKQEALGSASIEELEARLAELEAA